MEPSISPVWGNVDPNFVIIFRLIIYVFDICFVTFWHVFYHTIHYLALGTTYFVFMQVVIYLYYFMILLVKFDDI